MNTIQIKPVSRTADIVNISIVIDNSSARANVVLHSNSIMETYNITIEGDEYDAWGSDDNYIYDLILSKLGFERA